MLPFEMEHFRKATKERIDPSGDEQHVYVGGEYTLADLAADDGVQWAFATRPMETRFDADEIVESFLESNEYYDDAYSDIGGRAVAEMQAFLDKWWKEHDPGGFMVDYTRVLLFSYEGCPDCYGSVPLYDHADGCDYTEVSRLEPWS